MYTMGPLCIPEGEQRHLLQIPHKSIFPYHDRNPEQINMSRLPSVTTQICATLAYKEIFRKLVHPHAGCA
jgi:hypothetical protein